MSFQAVYNHLKYIGFTHDELLVEISTSATGVARKFIQAQLLVRDNPNAIIVTLQRYYGNPRRILYKLACSIEQSEPPRNLSKCELLDFALKMEVLITTAKAFQQESYLDHPILCNNISKMLRDEHQD